MRRLNIQNIIVKSRIESKLFNTVILLLSVLLTLSAGGVFIYVFDSNQTVRAISPNQYDFSPKMQLISSFNTDFSSSKEDRSHNVTLACDNFSWLAVRKGEKLSFNNIVGKRSEERGYRKAKVILNGEYAEGVGGGVCQVSTTLYNAWIRAGLGAASVRAHTLPSSYCELSQDATVTDFIDMVLVNDGDYDVLVNGYTKGGKIYFEIYGHPLDYKIKITSEITEIIPMPEPIVEWSDELTGEVQSDEQGEYIIGKKGSQGYKSKAFIEYYRDGRLTERKELRKDCYYPVQGKIIRAKKNPRPEDDDLPFEDFLRKNFGRIK